MMKLFRLAVLVALGLAGVADAQRRPKIIEGFRSEVTPAPQPAAETPVLPPTVEAPAAEDPDDLFGDATPPAENEPSEPRHSGPSVWDIPQIQAQVLQHRAAAAALFQQGKLAEAEERCRQSVELVPHDAAGHYLLACTQARQGKTAAALASLQQAVDWGFNQSEAMDRDANLQSLSGSLKFAELIAAAKAAQKPPSPWRHSVAAAPRANGQVLVSAANTAWHAQAGLFVSAFQPIPPSGRGEKPIVGGDAALAGKINAWYAAGTAAGNAGDFYDNHDTEHSLLPLGLFPQITRITWDDETRKRQFHTGLQARFLFNGIVIGNSSTALVGNPLWRSQARLAYVNQHSAAVLHAQYTRNHMYFYPEHEDHDENRGDVFPANTPYIIVSQGSSWSDQPFMQAVAYTLAALRPEVKTMLVKEGALMPTVQMLFRMSNNMVAAPADYLTGAAHPTVFDGANVQTAKMVDLAHALTADSVPPLVRMKVVEDDASVVGKDYFDIGPRQALFTTPSAIARVHRTTNYAYRMVVSAEPSIDLNSRPLTYHWKLLRGDAQRVEIKPLNDAGSVVELIVPFHPKSPIAPGSKMVSNRVDIGCFVHNGAHYSAPGFVTFYSLANERRSYFADFKPLSMTYNSGGDYVDPLVDVPKAWKDTYHYDARGECIGWTRERGDAKEAFTADGALVVSRDKAGRPLTARTVNYVAEKREGQEIPTLAQQPGGELLHYEYAGPEDKLGTIARREKIGP